jgi:asparagine synthase (glutamine-hydrolysing)
LASFFFLDYIHPPHTILRAARKLEPANYLTWSAGKTSRPQRYWTLKIGSNRDTGLADTLRDKLHAAVKSQLVSDVPVGVFLSGGIDSSVVATLAQEHSSHPLKTFTIRFDDPEFDESRFARLVSEHIKSEHIEENFDEDSLLANLDDAMSCLDEPLADPSILPTYVLSRLAARHVKVVLGGDGGDELWAGYPTYKAHRLARYYRLLPMALRRQVVDRIVHRLPVRDGYQTFEWKAKRFALRWDDSPALRHLRWMSSLDLPQVATVIPSFEHLPEGFHDLVLESHGDGLNRFLAMDFASYLPGSVLTKVDRASMAHGLEVRPPLLANDLIDFAFSLRGSCKLQGHTGKALLKRAVVDLLPREVIIRRKKGFAIPLSRWLRGPLRQRLENVVRTSPLWETGLLRQSRFIDWLRAHNSYEADYSRPLYALMVLDNWYRRLCRGTGRSLTAVSTVEKEYG